MKIAITLLLLFTIYSCNPPSPIDDIDTTIIENKSGADPNKNIITANYFLGIWQNTNDATDFLMFTYNLNDAAKSEGTGGTCPLKPDPNNKNLIDTTAYYNKPAYSVSFKILPDKISFSYRSLNKQEIIKTGEMKVLPGNIIKTPIGTFKKLTQEEIKAVNPQSS